MLRKASSHGTFVRRVEEYFPRLVLLGLFGRVVGYLPPLERLSGGGL